MITLGTKDRITAVERSTLLRDSRSRAASISQELHGRHVFASKLVVIHQEPSKTEVMVRPFLRT